MYSIVFLLFMIGIVLYFLMTYTPTLSSLFNNINTENVNVNVNVNVKEPFTTKIRQHYNSKIKRPLRLQKNKHMRVFQDKMRQFTKMFR